MQDYWNDPPEEMEPPECCGEMMTVDGNVLRCEVCLRCEEIVYDDPEPVPEPPLEELPDDDCPGPPLCPHGNEWTSCDHCDFLSDIAYDASRERR